MSGCLVISHLKVSTFIYVSNWFLSSHFLFWSNCNPLLLLQWAQLAADLFRKLRFFYEKQFDVDISLLKGILSWISIVNRFTGINSIEGCILYDCRQSTSLGRTVDRRSRVFAPGLSSLSARDPVPSRPYPRAVALIDGSLRAYWREPMAAGDSTAVGGADVRTRQLLDIRLLVYPCTQWRHSWLTALIYSLVCL